MAIQLSAVTSLFSALFSPITDMYKASQQRKQARQEAKDRIEQAKVDAKVRFIEKSKDGEIAWDRAALDNSGWKDEYMTIVLSIPLVGCFIPPLVPFVMEGFATLEKTPEWYQLAVAVMIASVFGMQKYYQHQALKRGALPDAGA